MDIKVIYKNADGFSQEHSESADSVKMLSFKTANNELTDSKLTALIGGGDGSTQHTHDSVYFQESEFKDSSAGAGDAGKPIKLNASGLVDASMISLGTIQHDTLAGLGDDDHTQYSLASGARDFSGVVKYSSLVSISTNTQIPHKKYVDDAIAAAELGNEWMESALTRAITPPGSPSTGDRVLIDGTLGTATGAFAGHEDSVAQYDGSAWVFTVPTTGTFISVDDETTKLYYFGGSAWEAKAFESTTASTGLVKVGMDVRIDSSAAGAGLGFSSGVLSVNVDNSSLEIATDTLQVKALGIKDSMIDFGTGASQVSAVDLPIADAANVITATEVEGALQEIVLNQVGVAYTSGEALNKGDLCYMSANNTISKLPLTGSENAVGLAGGTVSSGAGVRARLHNGVLTGVLSGATFGQKFYWTGSAISSTAPTGAGQNVWQVGYAKNATDLIVEVLHIKKNA